MRIIKFRGKNLKGIWNYGLLTHDNSKDSDYEWFISNSAGKPYAFGVIPETIGQFTGFQDKNGIDIYEGDILNFGGKLNEEVKFRNGSFEVFNEPLGWDFDSEEKPCEFNFNNTIIVGNIHENPNLCTN